LSAENGGLLTARTKDGLADHPGGAEAIRQRWSKIGLMLENQYHRRTERDRCGMHIGRPHVVGRDMVPCEAQTLFLNENADVTVGPMPKGVPFWCPSVDTIRFFDSALF
jgi:hypothetical protein